MNGMKRLYVSHAYCVGMNKNFTEKNFLACETRLGRVFFF